jgi:hypothetical protein
MAIPTATFTTYDAIGLREDLSDVIANISPVETHFLSTIGSTTAKARLHEWQTDVLDSPAANARIEGNTAAASAITATTRLTNPTQILGKTYQITDTEDVVDKAGRDKESAYQQSLKLKALSTDIEYALVINSSANTGATGTARQLKGVAGFIATNVTTGTGTGNEALTETMFNDNLALIWAQGGKPSECIAGSTQKRAISAFTGNNTRFINMSQSQIEAAVDVYRSDFGNVAIRLHYIMNSALSSAIIIFGEKRLWRTAWLRKPNTEKLARVARATMYDIECELTLESGNEKGSGKITQLT